MNNIVILDKEMLSKLYSKGYSMKEISELFGCSVGKVHKYFHLYNIKPRPFGMKNEFGRIKNSMSKMGKPSPTKGKKLTKEHIEKLKNKTRTDETKEKIRQSKLKKGIGHKKERNDDISIM